MQGIARFIVFAGAPSLRFDGSAILPTLASWRHRHRSRHHLATLDDRELADVGLTREQRREECAKPFWQ